ncbi:MAG: hypothetical protein RL338_1610 [Chloroflexota bacterium]
MTALRAGFAAIGAPGDALRIVGVTLVLALAVGGILALDLSPDRYDLAVGDIARTTIRAPRAVTFQSPTLTSEARAEARAAVVPQYDYTIDRAATIAAEQSLTFERTVAPIDAAFAPTAAEPEVAEAAKLEVLGSVAPWLGEAPRRTLLAIDGTRWRAVRAESARVLDLVERAELRDTELATVRRGIPGRIDQALAPEEAELAAALIAPLVIPNSSYSAALTAEARDAAGRAVAPVLVTLQQNEVIVDAGHVVTVADLEKIDALGLRVATTDLARVAGWLLAALLLVGLLTTWLARFRPAFWHRRNVLLLVALAVIVAVVGMKLTAGRSALPFVVPTAAAGVLLAILLDATTATVVMTVIAILAGIVAGGSLEITAYVLLGGIAGIVAIRRGDRFDRFVAAGAAIFLVGGLTVTTFSLLGTRDLTGILQLWLASLGAGVGAAVAALGTFNVLGRLFGILTAFQLLELANPSQPLLRRLLVETPGTYHHSLMVGNLAERAAEAIGADPLLTRVAAYYHDVGKLADPLAFIENQAGGENVHDELEPEASVALVKRHVADGIGIAHEARLPTPLVAFIPQHHGTALMSYFHAKAREAAAAPLGGLGTAAGAKAADAVDPRRFRHAGPKPQSREAALIMLADGVEASVRSLASRDEATLRAMVDRIVEERLTDGQLDECDLTLRDLERIREAFVAQLLGMYHQRVAYPQSRIVELESRRETGTGA